MPPPACLVTYTLKGLCNFFLLIVVLLLKLSGFTNGADGSSDERRVRTLPCSCTEFLPQNCLQPHSIILLMEQFRPYAKLIQWIINTRARWLQWFIWRRLFVKHMTLILFSVWATSQVNIPRTMNKEERRVGEKEDIRPNGNQRTLWNVRTTIDSYFTCSPEVHHT